MNPITFTVHGTPQPAGSKRGFYNKKTGRVLITDDAKHSRPWKALVTDAATQTYDGNLLEGPLSLELKFWMTRPKSHYGTGRNAARIKTSAPVFPAVKPDLLKLARAIEDALTGVVYRDDAQIVIETLQKAYTREASRVDVRIVPLARQRLAEAAA